MKWRIASPALTACAVGVALAGCATVPSAPRDVPVIERSTAAQPQAAPPGYPRGQATTEPPQAPLSEAEASRSAPSVETRATPVVIALLGTADRQRQAGQLPEAAASLERALRIEPRNPETWYQLALIRLHQGYLDQAEQLARKAEALAGTDHGTRARSWQLIAAAREQAGDRDGAYAARQTAETLLRAE